jgi:hypothetical protein
MNKYTFLLLSLSMILFISCNKSLTVQELAPETPASQSEKINVWTTTRALANPDTPSFSEIDIDFNHEYDKNAALSFLGGTFFDLESDGQKEFIITGWADQNDWVFTYKNWKIIDLTEEAGINNSLPSYGAYAIDFDENGYDDLFIARQDGIYYYENTAWKFKEKKLDITFPKNAVPLDIDFADIDSDNDLDIYVSTFITPSLFKAAVFNDPNHVQKNLLLQNNGDLNFTDITVSSQLNVTANTFTSSFVDLDSDGDADIVISPNTDSAKIFENIEGKFTLAYESDIYGFWMGLAISDVDNDGDSDIFFSNVGGSIPEKFLQWDSNRNQDVKSQYLFLENTGDMSFTEKKDPSFDELGFGWWIVASDINLDGKSDFLVMQNYIKWPTHKLSKLPGELLIQTDIGFDEKIKDYKIQNKAYGISALVWDINGDNFDDIIYLNLASSAKAYIRNTDNKNNFLKINIPNTAAYLLASFEILSAETSLAKKIYLPKQWLMSKQDSSITFGLNNHASIPDRLIITYINGISEEIKLSGESVIGL